MSQGEISGTDSSDSRVYTSKKRRRQYGVRPTHDTSLKQAVRSLAGFMFGLFLASVYGATALFLQNYGLWYCLVTTITIAAFLSFGMGLSIRVRSNVLLMLPMLCSRKGKNLLLFLTFSLVVQGPMTNTLTNFDRAAGSVACGAELAMNQTQELIQQASTPLLSVLSKIKEITRNVYSVAGRVQNFTKALTDSVRHVARILRNVLHFLVNISEVCNDKLGTPHKKCTRVFDNACKNCKELLTIFSFLCNILDGFRPLCGLAHVVQLFCIIPTYVISHMKTKLAASTIAALEQMKHEFDFNISASMQFGMHLNSSQSTQQVSQDIMGEVTVELSRVQEMMGLLGYVGLFLLLLIYLQAFLYKNKYLSQDDFDNIYVTDKFVKLDLRRTRQGRTTLLPLSQREALTYIRPCSLYLTRKERLEAAVNAVSVLRHIAIGCLVISLDLVVFWMFDMVHHLAQGEIVARAPIVVAVKVNGSGYSLDIFKDIVASFDILQKGNITVLSKKCLMEPSEPNYYGYIFIGILYGLCLFIAATGSYIHRFRRFVCASYYPKRERERVHFLYNQVLTQRGSLRKILLRSVTRNAADGEYTSLLQTLTAYLPCGNWIADFLRTSKVSCIACGRVATGRNDPSVFACSTTECKGLYCLGCYNSIDRICAICMGPLTFQEDSEVEIDSSHDEQLALWTAALKTMRNNSQRRSMRKLLKRRVKEALRENPGTGCNKAALLKDANTSGSDTSSHISIESNNDYSEPDMTYQNQSAGEKSECSDFDPRPFPDVNMSQASISDSSTSSESNGNSQNGRLHMVMVHSPVQMPATEEQKVQPSVTVVPYP